MPGIAVPRCRSASPISAVSSSATRAATCRACVAQVEPQVGGDLVVAAAAGAQLAAERAEPLEQAALEGGVHVLVVDRRPERRRSRDRGVEVVERGEHLAELVVVEQAGAVQHPGVRPRGGQVVGREPPVEVHADRQPGQRVARPAAEPPAPQPGRCVAVLLSLTPRSSSPQSTT